MTDINVGAITEALNDKADRDLNNTESTGKTNSRKYGMLDYDNANIIKEETTGVTSLNYTAPSDGKYYFECPSNKQIICKLNDTKIFGAIPATTSYYNRSYEVEVLSGDIVEFSGFNNNDSVAITFIPYKY